MAALCIASVEIAGKTALCAGIGKKLLGQGKKVGFMMPVISEAGEPDHKDVGSIKEVLNLKESVEQLCPTFSKHDLGKGLADFEQKLKQEYARLSKDKDVMLIEGLSGFGLEKTATQAVSAIAESVDAKVIMMLRYSPLEDRSAVVEAAKKLGQRLLGVVVNFVPESRMEIATEAEKIVFEKAGIKVLGVIPEVRSLLGVSVKELAEFLGGQILTGEDKVDGVVENIMLGAMSPDSGIDYFSRKANKAAVIRGERADMQLAALETSTRCLVLTGGVKPLPAVVNQAKDKRVPIMLVKRDVSGVIADIEQALAKASFNKPQKLQKFENILNQFFDFKALYPQIGLQD